jgi:hypothetical protein
MDRDNLRLREARDFRSIRDYDEPEHRSEISDRWKPDCCHKLEARGCPSVLAGRMHAWKPMPPGSAEARGVPDAVEVSGGGRCSAYEAERRYHGNSLCPNKCYHFYRYYRNVSYHPRSLRGKTCNVLDTGGEWRPQVQSRFVGATVGNCIIPEGPPGGVGTAGTTGNRCDNQRI